MTLVYLLVGALLFGCVGLIFALIAQQVFFLRAYEALQQKLLARDLTEYAASRVEPETVIKRDFFGFAQYPETQEATTTNNESDIYMDIDQIPSDDAKEAIMNHLQGK